MLKFRTILTAGVAVIGLAACGADKVDSAGGGSITINNPDSGGNNGGNNGGSNGGNSTVTAADPSACPTGTTALSNPISAADGSELRQCRINTGITSTVQLTNQTGVIYTINDRTDVGVDMGGDGNQAGGASGTLEIDPGVVVMAETADSFLVVNRGSQLNAVGTATNPIIFTSRSNVLGTVAETSDSQWGSVILLGQAPISNCDASVTGGSNDCENDIEGVGGTNAPKFGGGDVDDSSGNIRYVQIRFSGRSTQANSELQGLTTGGVGRGTDISYVQVHNSADDGIESFGGTQNMDHLVFTGIVDDSLDVDDGYQGAVQYMIAARRDGGDETSDPRLVEIDSTGDSTGKPVTALPRTYLRLANFTLFSSADEEAIAIRGGADVALLNGVVHTTGGAGCLRIYDQTDLAVEAQNNAPYNAGQEERGPNVIESVAFDCATDFDDDEDGYAEAAFDNGSNNISRDDSTYSSTLQMAVSGVRFINGTNETNATEVANIAQYLVDPFADDLPAGALDQVNFIGAAPSNASDPEYQWYVGWTCDSAVINFGSGEACVDLSFS